jgi:vancomycin resistance protein YoaR
MANMTSLIRALPLMALSAISTSSQAQSAKFGAATVGGVPIQNLDQTEAKRRLTRELAPKLEKRVGLALGKKLVYRKRSDLGFSLNISQMLGKAGQGEKKVPVSFVVDEKRIAAAVKRLTGALSTQSQDARPVLIGSKVSIRPEVVGRLLDASQSAARIKIEAEKEATKTRFVLAGASHAPTLTAARLKGIDGILGSFTTRFNPAQIKRTTNMRVAIRAIDGALLSPNEVFSLNQTVGERTQARGYRTAIIFEDGKKKPGLGGGVSQVTGTLFNAALVASLPIQTYRTHSRPVAYLPLGRDATVAWGSFDMKFKNDTGQPIFISYKLQGSRVTATLFGHKSGKKASLRVVSKRNGARDISAILYRTIRQNGKVVKKERVGNSRYLWKSDNED